MDVLFTVLTGGTYRFPGTYVPGRAGWALSARLSSGRCRPERVLTHGRVYQRATTPTEDLLTNDLKEPALSDNKTIRSDYRRFRSVQDIYDTTNSYIKIGISLVNSKVKSRNSFTVKAKIGLLSNLHQLASDCIMAGDSISKVV